MTVHYSDADSLIPKRSAICYGDIAHGKDGYYEEWAEEWAREEAHRQKQEEIERQMYEEEYYRTYGS